MTIPGVGPITSLYLVLTLGPVQRFSTAKQVVCYVGLDSVESSSDNLHKKRRYGSISKQGERTLRWLLVQSAVAAARWNPALKRFYRRLLHRKGMPVARVAAARSCWSGPMYYCVTRSTIQSFSDAGQFGACLLGSMVLNDRNLMRRSPPSGD